MEVAALLAFERAVDGIHSAENAAHGCGVASEGVRARGVGLRAVWAVAAVANAEEVAQREQHQGVETFCARQRISG